MIDLKRLEKLRDAYPIANAATAALARAAGEKPWTEPATVLLKMWRAPTLEEFDRHAKDFPEAFRRLRSFVITRLQSAERHYGRHLREGDLEMSLWMLHGVMQNANCGDPVTDPEGFARRSAMGEKFRRLMKKLEFRPK